MPIVDELNKLKTNIANAYTALENKGATMPISRNTDNLAATIETVTAGGKKEVEVTINPDFSNGAIVEVPTEGEIFKKVSVSVPSTLLPTNIKCGVSVAGVVGTFEGVEQPSTLKGLIDNSITDLVIPSDVTSINKYALYYMSNLANLDLNNVATINEYAFSYCTGLKSVIVPASVTRLGSYAFSYCSGINNVVINNSVLGQYMFYGCTNLTSVTINTAIKQIQQGAFYDCNKAKTITMANDLTRIYGSAFYNFGKNAGAEFAFDFVQNNNCYLDSQALAYSNVGTVSGTFSTVSQYAFRECKALTEVDFTFSSLGSYVFQNCDKLARVNFNGKSFAPQSYTFDGCTNLTSLENFTFTSMPSYFMRNCGSKRADTSAILEYNFKNCTFTSVADYALAGLVNTTVTLPSNVTQINANAFRDCDGLTLILNSTPNLSNVSAFTNNNNLNIFIDFALIDTLSAKTNWSTYSDNIKGMLNGSDYTAFPTTQGDLDLLWYTDSALTQLAPETPEAGVTYYCKTGPKYLSKVTALQCTCTVSDYTGKVYNVNDRIILGTAIKIQFTPDEGKTTPFQIKVNGVLQDLTGFNNVIENYIVEDDINVVCIYYDGVNVPLNPTFSENEWDLIQYGIKNRVGFEIGWKIGDTKQITTTDGKTYTLRIADTVEGRYNYVDGTPTNAVIEFVEGLPETKTMNSSAKEGYYAGGGWAVSDMNNQWLPQFFETLPSDLKAVIPEVTSRGYSITAPNPRQWQSKLFLMSEYEVYGTRYGADASENTSQYELYAQQGPANLQKHKLGTPTDSLYFWTRSPLSGFYGYFCMWQGSYGNGDSANGAYGVAPVFAI